MAELPQGEIIYIIILGSLAMLSLTAGFAVFIAIYQKRMIQEQEKRRILDVEYQQKMIQSQIDSQEIERKRIAADLHDSIGSLLWAAKLNIAFLGRSIPLEGELKNSYNETLKILDQSIDSVKRISWELTPEAFQHIGLSASIKEMCARLDGKGLSLIVAEEGNTIFWKDDRALMVFRIVQELINNAVKHARASLIKVALIWEQEDLVIEVSDNGIGFKPSETARNGVGWWNITHRSRKIGAVVTVRESLEKGSAIELKVALEE
jgi:two-component system, NarL family, sensor kinase